MEPEPSQTPHKEELPLSSNGEEPGQPSVSTQQHRAQAARLGAIVCAVLTVSDTRTRENDRGGALIEDLLQGAGHIVAERAIVRDEVEAIRGWALRVLEGGRADVLVVTGGSGIGPRDVSPEALRPLLSREMPGFGEVFRMLSWDEVGAATMLSRAFAGVVERFEPGQARRALLFVLPGSTNAVRLAMEKLILPDLPHLVSEARGRSPE